MLSPTTTPPDLPLFVLADPPLEPLEPFPPRRDVYAPPHAGSLGASRISTAGVPHAGSLGGASHAGGAGGFQSSMDASVCLVLIFNWGALQVWDDDESHCVCVSRAALISEMESRGHRFA